MWKKIAGSPITAVASIVMLGWGGMEFYNYVLAPHVRRWTGGM